MCARACVMANCDKGYESKEQDAIREKNGVEGNI